MLISKHSKTDVCEFTLTKNVSSKENKDFVIIMDISIVNLKLITPPHPLPPPPLLCAEGLTSLLKMYLLTQA